MPRLYMAVVKERNGVIRPPISLFADSEEDAAMQLLTARIPGHMATFNVYPQKRATLKIFDRREDDGKGIVTHDDMSWTDPVPAKILKQSRRPFTP